MINFGRIAYEVFKVLETYDYNVVMFDAGGTAVIEPKLARRFFSKSKDVAVDIIEDAENSILKFIKSESVPIGEVLGFSQALMKLANETYMMIYVIEGHDGPIIPKNFAAALGESRKDTMDLTENMYGTSRSSYLKLGKSRLIVKHSGKVDEAVLGSRSRRIDRMFVENASGERFLLETKYLSAGKAIAQHVAHGGSPSDEVGQSLNEAAEHYANLSKGLRHIRKNAQALGESSEGIRDSIAKARGKIRKMFERVYRNYETGVDDLSNDQVLVEAEALAEAKSQMEARLTCEGVEIDPAVLESIARFAFEKPEAVEETTVDSAQVLGTNVDRTAFLKFADDHVMELRSGAPKIDAEVPRDPAAMARALASISAYIVDDSLANLMGTVADELAGENPPKLARQIASRALKIASRSSMDAEMKTPVLQEHLAWIDTFTVENLLLSEDEDAVFEDSELCDRDEEDCDEDTELSREDVVLPKNSSPDLKREVGGKNSTGPAILLDDEDADCAEEDCSKREIAEKHGMSVCPANEKFLEDSHELDGKFALVLPGGDFMATAFGSEDEAWDFGATYAKHYESKEND